MSDAKPTSKAEPHSPPAYVPWKTFVGYVGSLKNGTVPHTLDSTVRPSAMAGGLWRQLTSSLLFLGLVDQAKVTREAFSRLVKASGSQEWKKAVSDHVLPAYEKIVDGIPIERATSGQLEKAFQARGGVSGQMLDKGIRFYLHALREAGIKYSDLLGMRKERGGSRKPRTTRTKPDGHAAESGVVANSTKRIERIDKGKEKVDNQETISFPLFFKGKPAGVIRVPEELDADDIKLIELQVSVIKAYAAQKAAD